MGTGDERAVDSTWWYWIAIAPLFGGLVALVGSGVALTLAVRLESSFAVVTPALFALAALGVVFGVSFPVALYRDARVVAAADVGWRPDGRRYAALGLLAVAAAFLGTIPVSLYYLSRRREHVGTP